MKHLILLIAVGLTMAGYATNADDMVDGNEAKPFLWSLSAGAVTWESLGNIETLSGGTFDDVGFGLEIAGHKRVSRWGNADVLVGVDLGFFTIDSNILGIYNELTQRGLYLTPSVKLGFGERSRYFLEAGAGWYNTDFAEYTCYTVYSYCPELEAPFEANALGAYLGFRARLGQFAFVSLRAHHADFGEVSGIDSVATGLTGPFYSLLVGASF